MKVFIPSTIKVRLLSRSPGNKNRGEKNSGRTENTHANKPKYRASRSSGSFTRSAQTESALRCYECQGIGHFGRECPTRLRRKIKTRQERKTRLDVRGVRTRLVTSLHTSLNGEALRKPRSGKRVKVRAKAAPSTSMSLKTLSIKPRLPFDWSTALHHFGNKGCTARPDLRYRCQYFDTRAWGVAKYAMDFGKIAWSHWRNPRD